MQEPDSPGPFSRESEKASCWWMQDVCTSSQKDFLRLSAWTTSPCYNSSEGCPEEFLKANTGSPDFEGHLKSFPISFKQQDLSAISFFQFQLHREESLLRNISLDKLLAPDENGNRLLHKAVSQGRRALTYVLARRFASLNKIDEKDAEKRTALHLAAEKNQHLMVSDLISLGANVNEQDSLGKTPLHLCAENGYLRVLQVLKNFKENGMGVEVNLTDHYGLTPLHCAALSHTVLVMESQKTDTSSDMGRFLKLRRDQVLEGINCLLQMGGKPELQGCGLLDALRRMPYVSPPDNISELFPFSSSDFLDIILKVKPGHENDRFFWLEGLRPSNSTSKTVFTGILNPITCIDANVTIMFIVSKEHYPIYDVNNLYNTNADFDWGDFRSLAEEVREASSSFLLFLFQFRHPAFFLKRGNIWEPEEQIDLESFNTNVFFELLLRQSLSVTTHLGHFKEEVKTMYHKLTSEISLLKELWMTTLSIPEGSEFYESTMIESYSKTKQQAEEEMQHRKQLAAEYEESMNKQMHLLHHDLKCQEEHYVLFNSVLREAVRLIEMLTNKVAGRKQQTIWSPLEYQSLLARIDTASSMMTSTVIKESHRLKAWGVLGEGMGAYLLNKTKTRILIKQELAGELRKSEVPIFPYIPYPICPNTGLPVKTKLPALRPEKMFHLGGLMLDPVTEIEVPVLAVTIHPHTGQKLSVGGTYLNPLTGTVTPLEIGGPMTEPEGGKIVPILGVSLDNNTGEVIPVGGLVSPCGNPMLLGDTFTEPLSGKTARVYGAHLEQDKVLPHAGSYRAMLEADWLISQTHVVNAVKQYKETVLEDACLAADKLAALKASIENMKKSFTIVFYHAMHCLQSLERKQKIASSLKNNGGKLGMIKYPGTEMWIPAVFGMKIPDPSGSRFMVPILGIDCDCNPRQPSVLAGTMEDADGKGLVPIAIGARTISPITGEIGPVIGAQTNPWTHNVIPTVQSLGALPRGVTDPDLMKHKEKVKDTEKICHLLERSSLQEAERRTSKYFSSQLGTELSFLCKVDRDEKEQEIQVLMEIRKALEKLMQFTKKMQLQEDRIEMQLTEKEQEGNHFLNAETVTNLKFRKVILALASEFQECILKQQAKVETAYAKLEYVRDWSTIQTQQAKVLFSGSRQCFENYQTAMFYGIIGLPHGSGKIIHQKLIPLLKSVVYMLEENSRSIISPETPGYSSRSTLRASASHSVALRTETSQENASASTGSSLLPTLHSARIRHLKQEIQTRFVLEKHACELALLELTLLMEEINAICYFCESSKAKEKEDQRGNWSVDQDNITANELQKFREQKIRKLKDQLKVFLGNKRAEKSTSSNFDPLQNLAKRYSEAQSFLGKDFHPDLEELRIRLEEGKEDDTQQKNSSLSSITESSWIPGIHQEADDQLLLFLTKKKP
ncbi:PREDICTED: uncharacterized protein LOC104572292 [Tinamus guttatus]|uniref:uncharacterized protein LOC104572292 n=1 Tax=Tinamus guttatus TaxID=94827 RepID=UPI00052F122B|nr:PREDICTED: uncharacterized protein LOC104572292 [Tinamus guttatus]